MKAIQFNATVPRYVTGRVLGTISKALTYRGPACTRMVDLPAPALPGPDWVRVDTRLGGICGSDLGTIALHTSPYFEPFTSFPYTFGHENVGTVAELGATVAGVEPGQRVMVEPQLGCQVRGIDPPCPACAGGENNLCQNLTAGVLSPGQLLGYCRDTGGSWSRQFVAHRSQLRILPEALSDENGVLLDPLAVGIHAVLLDPPEASETILIQGAGTVGLTVLAALRGLGYRNRVLITARHPHQAEAAARLGADEIISSDQDSYARVAELTGASLHKPLIGKRVMVGGADRAYECVGADAAIDDTLRLTRSGGTVVLVGMPGLARGIDWSSIFAKQLTIRASTVYSQVERHRGRTLPALDLALELLTEGGLDLAWMVTHRFSLDRWRLALDLHRHKGTNRLIKAVFAFPSP